MGLVIIKGLQFLAWTLFIFGLKLQIDGRGSGNTFFSLPRSTIGKGSLSSVNSTKVLLKTIWYWYLSELGAPNKSIMSYHTSHIRGNNVFKVQVRINYTNFSINRGLFTLSHV